MPPPARWNSAGATGVVPGRGTAARDVLDVIVHTERFLDNDHGAAWGALGQRLVELHGPVGGVERDRCGHELWALIDSAAIWTALMIPW